LTWAEIYTFTLVASLLVMSPGPNGLLIAKTVPTSGRQAGFANIAGFVAAFYLHGALSVLGISILLVQSALAFAVVKYLGAAYLCWIGVKSLVTAFQNSATAPAVTPAKRTRTLPKAFVEGFLTNALNPKVSMFYLAAFPQFITMGESSAASAFFLVFLHTLINTAWFTLMILLLSRMAKATSSQRFQRWLKGITGVVFVGFGLKLVSLKPSL